MAEQVFITVPYKGEDREVEIIPIISGYTYRFLVTVNETEVIFERDEEGSFRAMKSPAHMHHELREADIALLALIQKELEQVFG